MKALYTAEATAEAGRAGAIRSDDGRLALDLSIPEAMGGPGGPGTNPEQIFAGGYAACFHSAMQFIAGQKGVDTQGSSVCGRVSIGPRDDGEGFALAVALTVRLPRLAQDAAEALVGEAHKVCPYSNAVRGNLDVDLTVEGRERVA